ncbi:MAG: PAS domain S-box protein [Chloroflexi bacterium]|nr:PAS domain S-box protein [Chloroflexota bacterium]
MITTKKVIIPRKSDEVASTAVKDLWGSVYPGAWIKLLDFALLITFLLLVLTGQKVFYFHLIFVILTLGAFYWQFHAFLPRATIYVTLTTAVLLGFVLIDVIEAEELVEIPMLVSILLLVFVIAQQRGKAEDALRKVNEELEQRVAARTADLLLEVKERRHTEQTLRESEECYRHLVELSFETIFIHTDDDLLYVNPSGMKLLGVTNASQLTGKSLLDFVHPDYSDIVRARLGQIKHETKGAPLAEGWFVRPDGASVDVEMVTIPIIYHGQLAMQTVARDIRPRKQAEQARMTERVAIARDLHDSLGQSLGYLHLKLDEIADNSFVQKKADLHKDLVRMRDVANEAYEQIRGMLAALMPANTIPLAKVLRDQAKVISRQSHFRLQVVNHGEESSLLPILQQQLLWLCREALMNIVKHANAQQVKIELWWTTEHLIITITDDGCGFDTNAPRPTTSFGLRIMQERAAQLAGILSIQSGTGQGTVVTLHIPLAVSAN